jgi:hypothetical protein
MSDNCDWVDREAARIAAIDAANARSVQRRKAYASTGDKRFAPVTLRVNHQHTYWADL